MDNVIPLGERRLADDLEPRSKAILRAVAPGEGSPEAELLSLARRYGFTAYAVLDISERRKGMVFPHLQHNSFDDGLEEQIARVEDMSNCSVFLKLQDTNAAFPFTTGLDCRNNLTPAPDLLDAAIDEMLNVYGIRGGYCVPLHSANGTRTLVMYFGLRAEGSNQYPQLVYETIEHMDKAPEQHKAWRNPLVQTLNGREYDWIAMLASGYTLLEIAEQLNVSMHFAHVFTCEILAKLEVRSIDEAVSLIA